jgi:hypothetical protein
MTQLLNQTPEPMSDSKTLQLLVQLLLSERQEAMQERQQKQQALSEKEKQRRINAEYNLKEKQNAQALCTHKKGGKGLKGPKVDYAVSFHTFTNAESYIRCLICGAKWKNKDTEEYLVRRGEKIPNHTGIGWKQAYQMIGESSNTPTASEVQLTTRPIELQHLNQEDFKNNRTAVEL